MNYSDIFGADKKISKDNNYSDIFGTDSEHNHSR